MNTKLSNAIGGYFELEIQDRGTFFHDRAIALNSGRNALAYILNHTDYRIIHLPYYGCDALFHTVKKAGRKAVFYSIDENFCPIVDSLPQGEVLLCINYFGILDKQVEKMSTKYEHIILDNCQAFYYQNQDGLASFYSPRKFFGVPDGGFVYFDKSGGSLDDLTEDFSFDRCTHLLKRLDESAEDGYGYFKENESLFNQLSPKRMSSLTWRLLRGIDYEWVRGCRNNNFAFLHQHLQTDNELSSVINDYSLNGPMVYPFLKVGNENRRMNLMKKRIYTAQYWPEMISNKDETDGYEIHLKQNLLALPIDQRYTEKDMCNVLDVLLG